MIKTPQTDDPIPPADGAEATDRLRVLFAECERSAQRYFERSEAEGLDFDIRCAYAGLAGRLVRAAAALATHMDRPNGETVHRVIVERA